MAMRGAMPAGAKGNGMVVIMIVIKGIDKVIGNRHGQAHGMSPYLAQIEISIPPIFVLPDGNATNLRKKKSLPD